MDSIAAELLNRYVVLCAFGVKARQSNCNINKDKTILRREREKACVGDK